MPTYDFECLNCKSRCERFYPITSAPNEIKCGNCGKTMKRLIGTGSGIIFKGSGFYCTDYRNNKNKIKSRKKRKGGE
ncbi:zinc ribbon domain-containing protein [bacterium]|nr:zinc ribbon domain-containing protein [bacterium]